ncbi:transcription factor HES-4-B-like [Protopterus annectens]|uniref:transcription factor HES-4-B-like n=1 Tax=Protopterus annectens TaxID=7888 RepID=UPI001CFABEB0|nr:transcription factor HES-4-B-like [Protopterus annectens]
MPCHSLQAKAKGEKLREATERSTAISEPAMLDFTSEKVRTVTQGVTVLPSNKTKSQKEARKISKPIMEKRRRARINESLGQLKALLLDALKKDNPRFSKLEKADILEMAVKHLRALQHNKITASLSVSPCVLSKFFAGFNECVNEVTRFLSTCDGIDADVRSKLLNHLASCINIPTNGLSSPHVMTPHLTDNNVSTRTFQIICSPEIHTHVTSTSQLNFLPASSNPKLFSLSSQVSPPEIPCPVQRVDDCTGRTSSAIPSHLTPKRPFALMMFDSKTSAAELGFSNMRSNVSTSSESALDLPAVRDSRFAVDEHVPNQADHMWRPWYK